MKHSIIGVPLSARAQEGDCVQDSFGISLKMYLIHTTRNYEETYSTVKQNPQADVE
jgi:fructose-1,6-bisphosphatase